jgi:hypothetical protein
MPDNGDTKREFTVGTDRILGVGSFHKTLPHTPLGEVCPDAFRKLVAATEGDGSGFAAVPKGGGDAAPLANPQGGLAADQLTHHPASYSMPPAPKVLSTTTAAEMTELYWMALLRDVSFDGFEGDSRVQDAAKELSQHFKDAVSDTADPGRLATGIDVPGAAGTLAPITPQNVFRLGLPGEEVGPMVSQFFVRNIHFGTQTIDQKQRPYKKDRDYLTEFSDWLDAQNRGRDRNGQDYSSSNEDSKDNFEAESRYIGTMRDLARFVNKDALHQAYFNAALLLLSGGAKWTAGNPYGDCGRLTPRETGFGVLGGPHILALVSEVATRALKVVWNQKWQVNLRLRPEAYGGLVHVQELGVGGTRRPYGLPDWLAKTTAAKKIKEKFRSYLLPMAFTPGSPAHPAYGAGHATVAGVCVTVLKAYFKTFKTTLDGEDIPIPFVFDADTNPDGLKEREDPFGKKGPISTWITGVDKGDIGVKTPLEPKIAAQLTIEGELNKLAQNVAMGRSMGGVHWRTDNTRSLILGEALAAEILADITTDVNERPSFEFRTFGRRADGQPKKVTIRQGRIFVDGKLVDTHGSAL